MTNTNLLKSIMVAAGDEYYTTKLAEILDISQPTANNKLNGKIPFSQTEITVLATHYHMSRDQVIEVFIDAVIPTSN